MPEWLFCILMLLMVFLYNMAIGISGIDMTDEGYLLSSYQQLFKHPESASMFSMYNTMLIGGLWESAFGNLGILGFRLLAALCVTLISIVVYLLCRNIISRLWFLVGLGIVFLSRHYIFVFHYNQTSALVALLTALFIFIALTKSHLLSMFIAGVILGLGVFFRIPNVCLTGLILTLVPYYIHTSDLAGTLKFFCIAVVGFFVGVATNVGVIFLFHHQEFFMASIDSLLNLATTTGNTHNMNSLFSTCYGQYGELFIYGSKLVTLSLVMWLFLKNEKHCWVKWSGIALCYGGIFRVVYNVRYNSCIYILYAICSIVFLGMFLHRHSIGIKTHYVAIMAFLIMFLLPFGSDGYIGNVGMYSIYLAMPLALGLLWKSIETTPRLFRYLTVSCLSIIIIVGAYGTTHLCYRDTGSRLKKTAFVTESELITTLTNPHKAQILNSVLEHIRPYKDAETELLAYPSIPMINYMTNTRPFVGNSWVGVMSYDSFKRKLLYGEQHNSLPIIVISKASDIYWFNTNEWHNILDCGDWHPNIEKKNILLNDFINRHSYRIEYDDNCFQILIPEEK